MKSTTVLYLTVKSQALLFISAATDAKDVIERYWQTHFLHYNASVQSAAADRIRHFMQNTTISSPLTFRKTPLCLASIYEGKNDAFPEYARVLVDSVSRNKGYANLHLFVHNVSRGSIPHDLQRSNVKIVDIRQIHPSYAYRGFAGLITDRLCKHFKNLEPTDVSFGWEGIDQDCAQLERRLDAFEGQGGAAIDQLRGLWSVIFEAWVGPELCQSWGWIDAGTAIGDLRRWMDNDEIRNADLVTAHEGDQSRLYLRSAFTVHNYLASQSKGSTYWKRCKDLASLANLSAAFANPSDWQSLTEGCYSYGALTSPNVRTVLAPWQLPSWTDTRLLLLNDGRANYCVGESNAEVCRGWVRGFMEEQVIKKKKQLLETTDPDAAAAFRPYKTAQAIFSGPPRKTISTPLLAQDKIKCSDWIPREYNLCLDESSFAERRSRGEQAYLQEVHTDPSQSRTSAIVKEYDVPSDGVGIEGMNGGKAVGETLIVPFLRWATKPSTNEKAPAKKGQPVQVEQTWFYSVDKGSIQITPGKILLHTINGWW
ncbi:hypothetical protein DFS34DRAFT_129035 [Phlyctochytrium arcticum]|nr:hypothetical protein DFS34DRAFT_129035 [Phlyctochytrium arcticum]